MGRLALGRTWRRRGGRNLTDGRAATALLELVAYRMKRPTLLDSFDWLKASHPLLHWALGYPFAGAVTTSQDTVEGMHSLCRRTDPEVILAVNLEAIRELAAI